MAQFLKEEQLSAAIFELIEKADEYLLLISPSIKMHQQIKDRLKVLGTTKPFVEIVVVFGKNEDYGCNNINPELIGFLKSLPNITIGYEERLNTNFYSSEEYSLVTSMNLNEVLSNNNLEVGLKLKTPKWLTIDDTTSECSVHNYFNSIIDNCQLIFEKVPKVNSSFPGVLSTYEVSEITLDETEIFFQQPAYAAKEI